MDGPIYSDDDDDDDEYGHGGLDRASMLARITCDSRGIGGSLTAATATTTTTAVGHEVRKLGYQAVDVLQSDVWHTATAAAALRNQLDELDDCD